MENKFTNKLDIGILRSAIASWGMMTDGYEGAIGGVLGEIPYDEAMGRVIPWDSAIVHDTIDAAIGQRFAFDTKKMKDRSSAIEELSKFYDWVEETAKRVYETYDGIIAKLNSNELTTMKRYRVNIERREIYSHTEEVLASSREEAEDKVVKYFDENQELCIRSWFGRADEVQQDIHMAEEVRQ